MLTVFQRELVYLWYYFDLQLRQIFPYWLLGMLLGSAIAVFAKESIHNAVRRPRGFFNFAAFQEQACHDTDPNPALRFLKNLGRNLRATGPMFLLGVVLAATIGVPLYACGGGTIPLLQAWLADGMSLGSAAAFMITGPATKITNLGAVKIVLGLKSFGLYLLFVILFALLTGLLTNLIF